MIAYKAMINGNIVSFITVIAINYLRLIRSLFLNGNGNTEVLLAEKKSKLAITLSKNRYVKITIVYP